MSIFTHAGRAALAEIVLSRPIHLALGLGEDSWGTPPPAPDYDVTTLRREIGRKKLFRGLFVHPDDHGTLILPGDRSEELEYFRSPGRIRVPWSSGWTKSPRKSFFLPISLLRVVTS